MGDWIGTGLLQEWSVFHENSRRLVMPTRFIAIKDSRYSNQINRHAQFRIGFYVKGLLSCKP